MKKTQKIRYEVDPHSRLVISQPPKFRHVLDGGFKVDKNNTLIYHVKSPSPPSTPQQLKLTGNWSLDKKHNLVFTLNKENNQRAGDKLTLSSEIINAKADKLEFSVSTKDSHGKTHLYLLQLGGTWQADKYNRIKFMVQRKKDLYDELTFTGAWEVNKKNQIVYTYIKTHLLTKKKSTRTLTFKGFWDITRKFRLVYVLNKQINSLFDFSVSVGKPLKRGLQYELGIGVVPKKKRITLFGEWKLNKRLGVLLELPSQGRKIQSIVFGATCKLSEDKLLELRLKNPLQEDLGINLKLSKTMLKNQGEVFIQALKQGREISLVAGLGFRW